MNPLWRSFRELVKHIGIHLLGLLLPNKIKRITYLTSLHARLVRDGVFQQELLSKVNQALHLAKDDKALEFPAHMHHRLWEDERIRPLFAHADFSQQVCLPFDEAKRISEELVDMTPRWLRYAQYQDMVVDTLKLFYCQAMRPPSSTDPHLSLG